MRGDTDTFALNILACENAASSDVCVLYTFRATQRQMLVFQGVTLTYTSDKSSCTYTCTTLRATHQLQSEHNPTVLTLTLHLGPCINCTMNITQHKLHMSMRILPLSAVCRERLNTLQPKQPACWSEGYLKPKPGTYCHLPDVCRLCVLWSLSLSLQSVRRRKKVASHV